MEGLKNYKFPDSSHTLGNYMGGSYFYDIVGTVNGNEARLKEVTEELNALSITTSEIKNFIFNMGEYSELKKEQFESLDQARRINSETFSAIKCEYCGSHKTKVSIVQMRSSDEPATMFIACQNPLCKQYGNVYKRSE